MRSVLHGVTDYLLRQGLAAAESKAGLSVASVKLSFGRIEYLQRAGHTLNKPEAVLMLHGATADRSAWLRLARHLDPKLTLVIPDLPGHGRSAGDHALDYSIGAQAARIKEFLCRLTVGRVHVVANSAGGAIALHLASAWPDLVRSLTLISAAGVRATPSWLERHVASTGVDPMIEIGSAADFRAMLAIGMSTPPFIPRLLFGAFARGYTQRRAINRKIRDDLLRDLDQSDKLATIRAPALIIWGAADKVLSVDNAALLQQKLANSERVVLDGIGHIPMVEAPREVAGLCQTFFHGAAATAPAGTAQAAIA